MDNIYIYNQKHKSKDPDDKLNMPKDEKYHEKMSSHSHIINNKKSGKK